jgi:hypothetical protein
MLTLRRRHFTPDDDSDLMKLRGDAHHNTGRLRNLVAVMANTMLGQG